MLPTVDRDKFYLNYKKKFGRLTQSQFNGLEFLLGAFEQDQVWDKVEHYAYLLATVKHETANTFQPIAEYGRGKNYKYGKPVGPYRNVYYGRGYVQLTWDYNYKKLGDIFEIELYKNPNLALQPDVAYAIMMYGCKTGLFTGKSLDKYINSTEIDFYNSRRVINGVDRAGAIAALARIFIEVLTNG